MSAQFLLLRPLGSLLGRAGALFLTFSFFVLAPDVVQAQETDRPGDDTTGMEPPLYDPFGKENMPDQTGQGSGGVLTCSPYDNVVQTYFTSVSSGFYGLQYMLDSPLQIALGSGWSAYQDHGFGFMMKVRSSGFQEVRYDSLLDDDVSYYFLSFEGSFEYPYREHGFRSFKVRVHAETEPASLSMAGVGVVVAKRNLLIGADQPMDRRLEAEVTWMQLVGGYVMPLSPSKGGINLALCGAVDLAGLKYQTYYSGLGNFVGAKIGSVGWVFGAGWNANSLVNLSVYVGGEWSFSTGGLYLATKRTVFSDISRSSLYVGLQATGRWVNVVGGIQKEWENNDFQDSRVTMKALRYYLGMNIYLRR